MEYDCGNRRYRVAAIEVTDANGYKVEQTFPDDMPWHQVTDRDFEAQTSVVRVTNEGVDDYFRVCGGGGTEEQVLEQQAGIERDKAPTQTALASGQIDWRPWRDMARAHQSLLKTTEFDRIDFVQGAYVQLETNSISDLGWNTVLIFNGNRDYCGSAGCSLQAYGPPQKPGGSPELVLRVNIPRNITDNLPAIEIGEYSNNGKRNLILGGRTWVWNGSRYAIQ